MKTLVADDELVSRNKMQKIMSSLGESEAVDRGSAAIAAFKKAWENWAPFDLITLDISMPEMDGIEVLSEIREMEREREIPKGQQVKIMMVTSHSNKGNVIACIQAGCDDYIVKPFDRKMVIEKLKKNKSETHLGIAGKEDAQASPPKTTVNSIEDIIVRLKRGAIDLPSPPQIGVEFRERTRGADFQETADSLRQDMAISSKLISVSNSAYYGGRAESNTLEQAISHLGLDTTRQLVDAICSRALYATPNKKYVGFIERLWKHGLSCAYASRTVSELLKLKLRDDTFTMGLLHDIGKLALLRIVGELEIKGELGEAVDAIGLLNILNIYHGKLGADILETWKFSSGYVHIAMYHDNLEEADPIPKELLVVHFANLLVKSMGYNLAQEAEIDIEGARSTRFLKLSPTMIAEVKDQVKGCMEGSREIST